MRTKNFQMSKLGLEKEEEPEINCQYSLDHRESKGIPEKHLPVSSTMPKPLTVWIVTNFRKVLKRWECQTILPVS